MYDDALRELGRVTVAFTFLDQAIDSLLTATDGRKAGTWKHSWSFGNKLDTFRKSARKIQGNSLSGKIESWIAAASKLADLRNDAIKTLMVYGSPDIYPGIVALGPDGPKLINPSELEELAREMKSLAMQGMKLCAPIINEAGFVDSPEIEEGG